MRASGRDAGEDPVAVVEEMARVLDPGLVASAGPRYFDFVIGGALPAAVGADWLTGAWSQNAGLHALAPGPDRTFGSHRSAHYDTHARTRHT